MSAKVYVIKDRTAIDFIENNDIDGFRDYLAEEEYLMFDEPVEFETEREALKLGLHGGFGQESPARTFYPGAPHKYVLAAQGRRA